MPNSKGLLSWTKLVEVFCFSLLFFLFFFKEKKVVLDDLSAIQQCDFKFWICMFLSMCGLFFPMSGWVDQSLMKLLMKE